MCVSDIAAFVYRQVEGSIENDELPKAGSAPEREARVAWKVFLGRHMLSVIYDAPARRAIKI